MLIKVNIYDLTNAEYLAAMFRGRGVPDSVEIDDAELAEARNHAEEQHPEESPEQIYARAVARLAWKKYKTKPQIAAPSVTESPSLAVVPPPPPPAVAAKFDWKDAAWKIAVLILLLLIAIRGHAQIDVIKVQDNAGAAVGTIASPFTFKAGANCSWAKSASTYTFNCAGGAAGAGGVNTQVQWNSTGSLAGISSLTTDGTITTALAGADWLFADLTTPTKKFEFDASNISAATTRTMNVPDANATFAQSIAAVSHKFVTQMSTQGLFTLAQPACADISDAGVFCSGTAYSSLTGTPALPANTTATGSNFFTAYNSTTGAFTKAQPAYSDISGTLALASAVFANQGTTTTVLHGNAAGNPSFAAVSISADVSGLGTGVATFLGTPSSANFFSAITDEIGNGSKAVKMDSVSGTGTALATTTGALTSTHCVNIDANSNLVDSGAVCGGGSGTLATLTVGTASGGPSFSASTTYWLGQIQHSPSTTYADEAVKVPTTGTGTVDLACSFLIGGAASAGNVAFSVCTGAAGATCTASTNMSMASRNVNFSATGLTLTPAAGDLIAVKVVTPAWGTGASSTFGTCYIVIH